MSTITYDAQYPFIVFDPFALIKLVGLIDLIIV